MSSKLSIFILICFSLYLCQAKKTYPSCGNAIKQYYLRMNGITENPKNYEPDLITEESRDRAIYVTPKKVNQYKPVKQPWSPKPVHMNYGYNCRKFREKKCFSDGKCCSMYCWRGEYKWTKGVCKNGILFLI